MTAPSLGGGDFAFHCSPFLEYGQVVDPEDAGLWARVFDGQADLVEIPHGREQGLDHGPHIDLHLVPLIVVDQMHKGVGFRARALTCYRPAPDTANHQTGS